jgi:hypothetical protein
MRITMLIVSVAAIAACSRGGPDTKPADTLKAASSTTTTAVSAAAVPYYEVVGHHAENAYDYVKAADWGAARASVDSLKTAVEGSQPQDSAGHGAELRASLARLDSAVTQRSRLQGVREANHLTEIGAQLSTSHKPPVPVDVTMLDYYGRELEIGATANDNAQLSRAASAIRTTWNRLRPTVVARGGSTEATQFDKVVASVRAARTPAQYAKTATLLDQVDALEAVFTR